MSGLGRVVIIGGGIAGWSVASALRAGGHDGPIVVVEREPACYDRPPLSKTVLAGPVTLASLAFADPASLAQQRIEVRDGRVATSIDPAAMTVTLDDGAVLGADAVVLATGAAPHRPAFPGSDLPGVQTLAVFADAERLRALSGGHVTVVGGGFIGAEVAASLRDAGTAVDLVEPEPLPGVHAFGGTLAAHLHDLHTAHGVRVHTETVAAVTEVGERLRVQLAGGAAIETDGVLLATGVVPETALAQAAGLAVDGGVLVDRAGRTSAPGIFAVGDAAGRRGADGSFAPAGHWEAAQLDGQAVAAAILGLPVPTRGAPWFWSDRYGLHVEVVGELTGPGEEIVRPGPHPTVFRVDDGMLRGAAAVDDPLTVRAARRLIDQGVRVDARLLADPDVAVRTLLPKPARHPS
ncbi:NAD(P)/FAD-dependent oxidoreductase [Microbacterium sp. GXF7504]